MTAIERAYDLARSGETVELDERTVDIYRLELTGTPDTDHALLVSECGKGTYVRSLARDLGRALQHVGRGAGRLADQDRGRSQG